MLATQKLIARWLSPSSRCLLTMIPDRLLANQGVASHEVAMANNQEAISVKDLDRKDFFGLKELFTVEDLFKARVHFGHKEGTLNGHMRPFIYGKRLGVLILDLDKTTKLLEKALNVTAEIAYREGIILFIHSSRQTGYLVEDAAKECGEYAHCRRWRRSTFTNSRKLFGAVTRLPDLVIVLSTIHMISNQPHIAVTSAAKMLIPTVGICDTNSDPTLITYPVPGNDDSPNSIEFYCHLFKTAILKGKTKRTEIIEKYGLDFYNKTLKIEEQP